MGWIYLLIASMLELCMTFMNDTVSNQIIC